MQNNYMKQKKIVISKNFAAFTDCISEINNTQTKC